jgi:hypothetical protein
VSDTVVIDQRFRLGRVVRESTAAIVYEAKHRNGADAWIKFPRSSEFASALATEAQVANLLGKNAVNVRDDGRTPEGTPYLVLEPVKGQPLDHWRDHSGGRAPPDEAMGLGDELCDVIGNMHRAGFVVGILRADAIVVLPRGGICLLELEHARPASPAGVKADAELVGRVLYEMLSGVACLTSFPPLRDLAPELPAAMLATVDEAARGRYERIEDLRLALRSSMPQWLGPMRAPMPSVPPNPAEPLGFAEIVLPRSSGSLFDPGGLVESTRSGQVARVDPAMIDSWEPRVSQPSRPSADLEAPPVAHSASHRLPGERSQADGRPGQNAPRRRSGVFIVAGAAAAAVVVGTATFVAVVKHHKTSEPPSPVAKLATSAVAPAVETAPPPAAVTPTPPASTAIAAAAPAAPAPKVEDHPPKVAAAAAKPPGNSNETRFKFEGDLSPRLVILDGAVVGVTNKPTKVRCGTHSVKIGGKGVARSLDLPCGEEQRIAVAANGTWHPK